MEQSVDGGKLAYRCGVNLVEGDKVVLFVNGQHSQINEHTGSVFVVPPEVLVAASGAQANFTVRCTQNLSSLEFASLLGAASSHSVVPNTVMPVRSFASRCPVRFCSDCCGRR